MSKISDPEKKRRRLARIIERDGDRCWFCRRRVPEGERSIYHLRPRFLGGTGEQTNQVMTCEKCAAGACSVWPINERVHEAIVAQHGSNVRYRSDAR